MTLNIRTHKGKYDFISQNVGFKLFRKAKITKEEKLLVLSGIHHDNKITLYAEGKKPLKKFKVDSKSRRTSSTTVKLEPTLLADNDEALLPAGYVDGKRRR